MYVRACLISCWFRRGESYFCHINVLCSFIHIIFLWSIFFHSTPVVHDVLPLHAHTTTFFSVCSCLLVNKLNIYLKILLQFYYTYLFDLTLCDRAYFFLCPTHWLLLLFIRGHFVMRIILSFFLFEFDCIFYIFCVVIQ